MFGFILNDAFVFFNVSFYTCFNVSFSNLRLILFLFGCQGSISHLKFVFDLISDLFQLTKPVLIK